MIKKIAYLPIPIISLAFFLYYANEINDKHHWFLVIYHSVLFVGIAMLSNL